MRPLDKESSWFTLVLVCFNLHTGLCQCSGSPLTVAASETPTAFTTPGYPTSYANNIHCEWLIDSGVAGQAIMLYSDNLDVDCAFGDTVNIYDGNTNSATSLQSGLCGSNLQTTEYTSSDRYVLITFTTDASNAGQGFQMTYLTAADTSATGCSSEYVYTASTSPQYLTSASFPSKYSSKSSCRWRLSAPNNISTVTMELVYSDIEDDASCKFDQLIIYDGQVTCENKVIDTDCLNFVREEYNLYLNKSKYICENEVLHTDCSTRTAAGSAPPTVTSTSDNLLVIFTSDDSYNRYGFVIKYTANLVTTTAPAATTTNAGGSTTTVAGGASAIVVTSATQTETEKEVNVTMMVISALTGSAVSLLTVALIWKIKRLMKRKKTKPGLMTVQSIAPLPPRSTLLTTRSTTHSNNALSFV